MGIYDSIGKGLYKAATSEPVKGGLKKAAAKAEDFFEKNISKVTKEAPKSPSKIEKSGSGLAVGAGLGAAYETGRYDEKNKSSDSESSIDYSRVDAEGNSFAKGGMSVEDYAHAQKNPHAKKGYSDGGEIHITKGHDYIKDLIK